MRDAAVHRAHQIGQKHHGALEHADEMQVLTAEVGANLVRQVGDARLHALRR